MVKKTIGEAAGGGADVEANEARGFDREVLQSAFQFHARAARILEVAALHIELGIGCDWSSCFASDYIVHADFAGKDHSLSFWLGFGETALDEEKVEPLARWFGFHVVWMGPSGATLNEIFSNFEQARSALAKRLQFASGFCGKLIGDLMRTFEAVNRGIGGLLLSDVFPGSFSKGRGRFFDVENVIRDLKEKSERLAKCAKAGDIIRRRSSAQSAGGNGSANESGGFGAVDKFEHGRLDALAFGFEVGDLAADHAVDGAGGFGDFREHGDAAAGVDGRGSNGFESESKKSVTGENGGGFAKFFVAGGFAAAEIVVVESGEIIVNEGIGVDELDGAGRIVSGRDIRIENASGLEAENRADAFAAGENAVAHGLVDGRWLRRCSGHEAVERGIDRDAVFFKENRELHNQGRVAQAPGDAKITTRS